MKSYSNSGIGRYGDIGVAELRWLKELECDNRKLKQLVADLSLDRAMLQDIFRKKPKACLET
ncbi:hypothetical protein E3V55_05600 [Candidatus Marinimicrobia bacterium MT.SAG.3]|nr:hypothetical protein E3V55_05600 [Candidatus Marinimicrobia bacterium MT.SAG.3]